MKTASKAVLFGGLKEQPKLYKTQNGKSMASFQIATKRFNGTEEVTDWLDVVAWGSNADYISLYGQRGAQVYAWTYPVKRNYEKDGVKHWVTEFICEDIKIVRGGAGKEATQEAEPAQETASQYEAELPEISNEDLPF